ncbi:MAG: LacI family transcriptional regulator [Clostridiales bacterium]|nr:MAG: LacI family transcriptional regulator [Clostridiales bacterium]
MKPKTADIVKDAIRELDYHPNFLGRTLRRLETMKILVLAPTISNQFYSRIIKGIQSVAEEEGYHIMLAVTNARRDAELEYIEMLQRKLVDGIIFLHSTLSAEELSEFAASWPMVLANEIVKDAEIPLVTIDNQKAAYEATRFLIDNGHRTVALASAGDLYYSSTLRRQGYIDALSESGIPYDPNLVTNEGFSFNAGRRSAEQMMQWSKLPDAVFAVADSVAIGMTSVFHQNGIEVGKDISIIGFDNNQIAEYYIPSITTVSQPQLDIGQKAMELLMNKLEDLSCENRHIVLPHRIEIRTSVKLSKSEA